jgi:hypothetical protein
MVQNTQCYTQMEYIKAGNNKKILSCFLLGLKSKDGDDERVLGDSET